MSAMLTDYGCACDCVPLCMPAYVRVRVCVRVCDLFRHEVLLCGMFRDVGTAVTKCSPTQLP